MPALVGGPHGNRLGQGGGCHHRALARRHPDALVLALLHDGEASEASLPAEAHDERVDGWVTTSGVVVLLRGRARRAERQLLLGGLLDRGLREGRRERGVGDPGVDLVGVVGV